MNYVLFCDKTETKAYKDMFKNAADSNLLAAQTVFNNETIDEVIAKYNPHGIIIAETNADIEKTFESIKYAREMYDDMRIILIYPNLSEESAKEIKKYTPDVITRAITSEDFRYIINNRLTGYDIDILNGRNVQKAPKPHIRFALNKKFLIIILAVVLAAFLIFGIIHKATEQNNHSPSEDGTAEVSHSETERETESESVMLPTEKETEPESESDTSITDVLLTYPTSPTTEKATEKPTEKQTTPKEPKAKTTDPPQSQAPVQQPVQSQQPQAQQTQPQTDPIISSTESPTQYIPQTAPQITDDGRIYLEPTDITLKLGESFDIYVLGLAAANGCTWNVQNAAVADFLSGDTTKITIKAKGIGVTVITATSKSSGYSVQCKVTVKK